MKKLLFTLFFCLLLSFSYTSCNNNEQNTRKYPKAVYKGVKWDLVQINESIYTLVPGINVDNTVKPIVFNAKHFNVSEIME